MSPLTTEEEAVMQQEQLPTKVRAHLVTTTTRLAIRTSTGESMALVDYFSSLQKTIHTMAIVRRWHPLHRKRRGLPVNHEESQAVLLLLVKQEQATHFEKEIRLLQAEAVSELREPLAKLNPFLENGLLRVGGRLDQSDLRHEQKHPLILSHKSRLAHLLVDNAHKVTFHGGIKVMLQYLRNEFWIINGRQLVKSHCIVV